MEGNSIKDNPAYVDELIRHRARLDEEERRETVKAMKKGFEEVKKEREGKRKRKIHFIFWIIIGGMVWFMLLKPLLETFWL